MARLDEIQSRIKKPLRILRARLGKRVQGRFISLASDKKGSRYAVVSRRGELLALPYSGKEIQPGAQVRAKSQEVEQINKRARVLSWVIDEMEREQTLKR